MCSCTTTTTAASKGAHPEETGKNRRPAFLALGEFRPGAEQPIWFSESKQFMDNDGARLGPLKRIDIGVTRASPREKGTTSSGIPSGSSSSSASASPPSFWQTWRYPRSEVLRARGQSACAIFGRKDHASAANILFVMTDHTNAQALAPGSRCLTPHLDALAAQGTRFACTATPRMPSARRHARVADDGLYPSTHGMWDCTHTQRREWLDVRPTGFTYFSRILADAGYYNAYFGEWHVEQSNQLERFGWHEYDLGCASARPRRIPGTEVVMPKEGYRDYTPSPPSPKTTPSKSPRFRPRHRLHPAARFGAA